MITGKNVRLRAIDREDLPRFVRWLNDPDVRRHLVLTNPLSMAQEELWYQNLLKAPVETHPFAIEINQGEAWIHIGNVGLSKYEWTSRSAEAGIFIGEKGFWNQGYGKSAMRLILRYGFNNLNLNRICLHVYANNLRAIRAYEGVGFVHEGRLRKAAYRDGQFLDVLVMSVLRDEWQDIDL